MTSKRSVGRPLVDPEPPGVRDQPGPEAAGPRGTRRRSIIASSGPQVGEHPGDQPLGLGDPEQGAEACLELGVGELARLEAAQQPQRLAVTAKELAHRVRAPAPRARRRRRTRARCWSSARRRSRRPRLTYASPSWARRLVGPTPRGDRPRRGRVLVRGERRARSSCRSTFVRIAGGRSNLTYGVRDAGGRALGASPPAAGQAPRLGPRHGPRAPDRLGAAGHGGAGPPVVGHLRGRSGQRGPVLRHGVRRGPDPALAGRGRALSRPRRARRAIGERVVDTLVEIHGRRSRRGRPRRAGQARRTTSPASCAAGRASGKSQHTRRAGAGRRGPRPTRGTDPRAGTGDARPRRLSARQHDPRRLRRGRGGRRLGAVHARRPARRRRHAARLLGRARATS